MNNETKQQKRKPKSFYTALLISLAMVSAACAYAYEATTAKVEQSLTSIQGDLTAETEAETETQSTTERPYHAAAELVTQTFPSEEEQPEQPPETKPETEAEPETESVPEPTGEYVQPLEGEVINPFSEGELVKSETTGTWQTHNGADIAAEEGAAVHAIDNGTVSEVVKDGLWGICVEIDHGNGIVSRYCGLSPSLGVQEGDTVERGGVIGAVGNTADVESKLPSHLHFEVLKNGIFVNPMNI